MQTTKINTVTPDGERLPFLTIAVSAETAGLGLLQWWHPDAEQEEEEEYQQLQREKERIEKMEKEAREEEKRLEKKKGPRKQKRKADEHHDEMVDDEENELVFNAVNDADEDPHEQDDEWQLRPKPAMGCAV